MASRMRSAVASESPGIRSRAARPRASGTRRLTTLPSAVADLDADGPRGSVGGRAAFDGRRRAWSVWGAVVGASTRRAAARRARRGSGPPPRRSAGRRRRAAGRARGRRQPSDGAPSSDRSSARLEPPPGLGDVDLAAFERAQDREAAASSTSGCSAWSTTIASGCPRPGRAAASAQRAAARRVAGACGADGRCLDQGDVAGHRADGQRRAPRRRSSDAAARAALGPRRDARR